VEIYPLCRGTKEHRRKTIVSYRILVVNPGSTSTKIGVYEDEQLLFDKTLRHSAEDIAQFNTIPAQKDWRRDLVMKALREQGFDARTLSAVSGRGGLLRPIRGGTYAVNDNMVKDCTIGVQGQHASNLGGLIAREIGDELGIPSYIVDPVVIDEMADVARYAGHPLFQRVSIFHALNQKAVAKRFAKEQGKKYEELNLIVCHMGGGVSIGAHMKGSVVDTQNALDGEGPFSPERSGSLPTGQLVKQCFSGKYTEGEMHRMLSGRGGLVAYTGSNDMRYLLAQAEHDKKIAGVVDAFHYQIGKEIGAMAAVMHGEVDQIILTGGIAYGKETVDAISEMVGWIAPITVYPGEDELLALAQGALRVLKGEEKAQEYRRPRPDDNK
jgi:butyrate kinase